MNRRKFLLTGIATCVFCRSQALARPGAVDCRSLSRADAQSLKVWRDAPKIKNSLGVYDTSDQFQGYELEAREAFGVTPALAFYDDGKHQNALAVPNALFPDGPDGTVLIGSNLAEMEWNRPLDIFTRKGNGWEMNMNKLNEAWQSLEVIVAHEFAHILQYKRGMTPRGAWQMEPHADFMAGWLLGRQMERRIAFLGEVGASGVGEAARSMFERGDYAFNDSTHHGEPQFRAAMVVGGFNSRKEDLSAAFEVGRKFAGLA